MYFDARNAKALQPGQHIVVQGCPGLRLESSITRKTWTYRYRSTLDQKLRQIKIGIWPEVSISDAIAEWKKLQAARNEGRDPAIEKKVSRAAPVGSVPGSYTVSQMVEDYSVKYLQVSRAPKGAHQVTLRLRKAVASIAVLPAHSVSRGVVFELIRGLSDRPMLARSVKSEMAAAWRLAQESGCVSDDLPNWWEQKTSLKLRSKGAMREGKHKGTDKRVLSDQEIKLLVLEDLPRFSQQVRDFLELQLWTCTRGIEICRMQRSQISQAQDGQWWWTIPKSGMKTRHIESAYHLRVPLFGRAEKIVQRLLAEHGELLFPCKGRDGTIKVQHQSYMQSKVHYFQPYSNSRDDHQRERLTVTHWSPHDLRRTGRTLLASMGCPHEVGEAILGHVLPGVAGDYNLYHYDAERIEWLSALSVKLEALIAA